jgi:Flp pilus assembly protein TadD
MPFKFCPECGVPAQAGARFCTGCGRSMSAGSGASPLPLAGLASLVALTLLGGGFWLYLRLVPPAARPLKPGEGRPAGAASGGAPASADQAHPPMQLPDDIKQYIANLAKEAEGKPKDVAAWQNLARVYYRASRLDPSYADKAKQAFDHVLELDPKNLEGLQGLGNIAYDQQDRAQAIAYYQKYLQQKPDDSEVRTDMGTMLFESGNPDEAVAEFTTVIGKDPKFFQAYFNLAVVYDAQGKHDEARKQLEKARELAPDDGVKQRLTSLLAGIDKGLSFADAAAQVPAAPPAAAPPAAAAPASAPAAGTAAAPAADSFQGSVEQLFRNHPVAGPKVTRIDWSGPGVGRVLMNGFPMEAMPEMMRNSYLEKMRKGVADAQTRFAVGDPVTVEIVDAASGKVMATVKP